MLKRLVFGEFKPDLPPGDHLIVARNVLPNANGYGPVPAFTPITPALSGLSGAAAFVSSTGEASFLGGDHNSLNRYSSGTWSPLIVALTADRWRFGQFGDNIISVSGGAPVTYDAVAGSASLLGGAPPASDLVAIVRDFVVLAGDPDNIQTVSWSGFNDSEQWTPTVNQSDRQQMLDGGEVMGLAGGEYGIILQKNAVKRMSHQGGAVVFSFDEIASNVGCMAKGSVVQAGRLVFFLSERGFMLCDGNDVRPIGEQKIDATFFRTYSRQDITNGIYAAVDPTRNIALWSMPGTPGTLWCYHYTLDRWSTLETDVRLVTSGFTANISLDGIDAMYGNLDAVPVSLDDPLFSGGSPLLLIGTSTGVIGTLSGDPMSGTMALARCELAAGRARVSRVRPITDAVDVTVQIDARARSGDSAAPESGTNMRRNGDVPLRVNAREFVPALTCRGAWTFAQGMDVEFETAGVR